MDEGIGRGCGCPGVVFDPFRDDDSLLRTGWHQMNAVRGGPLPLKGIFETMRALHHTFWPERPDDDVTEQMIMHQSNPQARVHALPTGHTIHRVTALCPAALVQRPGSQHRPNVNKKATILCRSFVDAFALKRAFGGTDLLAWWP